VQSQKPSESIQAMIRHFGVDWLDAPVFSRDGGSPRKPVYLHVRFPSISQTLKGIIYEKSS